MTQNRQLNSPKTFQWRKPFRTAVIISLVLLALLVPGAPTVALIVLGFWSLLGARQAIQSLTLVMLIKSLNPALYSVEGLSSLWFWLVLFVAATRIYFDAIASRSLKHPVLPVLLLFSTVVLLQSVSLSYYPAVSAFKIFSFFYVAAAFLLAFKLTNRRSMDWTPWFIGMWIAVAVLSAPTLLVPQIGYFRDDMGFQGILVHPQTFALFLAPGLAWLIGRSFFSSQPTHALLYAIFALTLVFVFLTRARTAIVAIIAALILISLIITFSKRSWRMVFRRWLSHPLSFGVVLIGMVSLFFTASSGIATEFFMKGEEAAGFDEAFEKSRGFIIAESWQNFVNHPFFGIGFGVSFADYFAPVIEPVTGLPLSAATEKGLLPVVILEETGIVGAVFFLPLLFVLIRRGLSHRDMAVPLMLLTCFFVNIGEMVFFSMGAMGLYLWLLIGWAVSPQGGTVVQRTIHDK